MRFPIADFVLVPQTRTANWEGLPQFAGSLIEI
jgi:hypothetical protein